MMIVPPIAGKEGGVRKILHLPVRRLRATLFFNPQGRRCPLEPQDSFDTAQRLFSPHPPPPPSPPTFPTNSYINIARLRNVSARTLPTQTFLARLHNRYSIVLRRKRRSKVRPRSRIGGVMQTIPVFPGCCCCL